MQFGGRYGFGSVSVRIRCICETALTVALKKFDNKVRAPVKPFFFFAFANMQEIFRDLRVC